MPNVMVALPNIGGALCSTPQFGVEEGTFGPLLLHAKFHPHRCNDKGVGPQN